MSQRTKRRRPAVRVFVAIMEVLGAMALRPRLTGATRRFANLLADLTMRSKGAKPQPGLRETAEEWQRMFPSRKFVPIVEEKDGTVYAHILGGCPVKATGDRSACYRLMGYDRRILENLGGTFTVLESQADPGVERCLVAIRLAERGTDDLVPAHLRDD